MGIFGLLRNIGGGRPEENPLWNLPQTIEEIDEILNKSQKPQIIYKHSYSCGVSLFAKSSLDSGLESIVEEADLHLIDVVAQRQLSKEVAEKTGIRHESPQLIVMHQGHPYWHTSHGGVRKSSLNETLNELKGSSDAGS
jgi:bacillithiol system protein YtxJ